MTQASPSKTNREIEKHYFERLRKVYKMPDGCVVYGDKPDVIVSGAKKIGIEITNFYLQAGSLRTSEQRQRQVRECIVAKAQKLYRDQGGRGIELTIGFHTDDPITPPREMKLPDELAALARRIDSRAIGQLERSLFQAIPEISSVYLNTREYQDATWRVMGTYTVGLMSEALLEGIVREKESKSAKYEPCDAYWLLIVVEAMDPAQEQEIRIDGLHIASNVFEKIIFYKPGFDHLVEVKA
ncbi:MAG: hypothetical protein ACREC0_10890 [Methylocella sp.]